MQAFGWENQIKYMYVTIRSLSDELWWIQIFFNYSHFVVYGNLKWWKRLGPKISYIFYYRWYIFSWKLWNIWNYLRAFFGETQDTPWDLGNSEILTCSFLFMPQRNELSTLPNKNVNHLQTFEKNPWGHENVIALLIYARNQLRLLSFVTNHNVTGTQTDGIACERDLSMHSGLENPCSYSYGSNRWIII